MSCTRRSELNRTMMCSCGASCSLILDHPNNCYICSGCLLTKVRQLQGVNEKLWAALEKHGRHLSYCVFHDKLLSYADFDHSNPSNCSCGLSTAIIAGKVGSDGDAVVWCVIHEYVYAGCQLVTRLVAVYNDETTAQEWISKQRRPEEYDAREYNVLTMKHLKLKKKTEQDEKGG